jgi:alpha/beta superfamily hydrolase
MPPPCSHEAPIVERVRFQSGAYQLEGELAYPELAPLVGCAVLAAPHPLLGGSMHNNVVRGLGDGLAAQGFVTLRFNYRGVENSQGPRADTARHLAQFWETSHVPDEPDLCFDVEAAVAYLRQIPSTPLPLALIGYSFGCTLLPHARGTAGPTPLVLIAPTLGKHDYRAFESLTDPILVIASEDDFAIDRGQLITWFDRIPAPKRLIQARLDNHFFRDHEPWLLEQVAGFLAEQWSEQP